MKMEMKGERDTMLLVFIVCQKAWSVGFSQAVTFQYIATEHNANPFGKLRVFTIKYPIWFKVKNWKFFFLHFFFVSWTSYLTVRIQKEGI